VNSVFAYSPTSKDNSLLESIEHRINDMSVNNLVNIVNRLEIVLDKLSRFSRTYYMLSEIEKYIGDRIVADALKQQESYP
jgi:predicted DNA-binding protein